MAKTHEFGVAFVSVSVYTGRRINWLRWGHAFKVVFAGERKE